MKGRIGPGRRPNTWYLRVSIPGPNGVRVRQRLETVSGSKEDAQRRLRRLLDCCDLIKRAQIDLDALHVDFGIFVAMHERFRSMSGTEIVRELLALEAAGIDFETFKGAHERKPMMSATEIVRELADAAAKKATVGELLRAWLEWKGQERKLGALGGKTYLRYAAIVRLHLEPTIGSIVVDELTRNDVGVARDKWIAGERRDRKKGHLKPRSVKHILDTLKMAFTWAVETDRLARNPAAAVKLPKVARPEMKTLDAAGVAQMLRAAEGTELYLPILVAIFTGLRRGELLALRWGDVDLDTARLTVHRSLETVDGEIRTKEPKTTRSTRTIALAPTVVEALRGHRAAQIASLDRNGWVFDRGNCEPWEPGVFTLAFARFVKRWKLPKVRFHDLRHTYATLQLAAGTDIKTISSSLGHSAIGVTGNIYLHAVDSLERAAADRLDTFLRDSVPESSEQRVSNAAHVRRQKPKIPLQNVVAPTGIEPVFSP